jgi:hypothetical protein
LEGVRLGGNEMICKLCGEPITNEDKHSDNIGWMDEDIPVHRECLDEYNDEKENDKYTRSMK